MGDSLDLLLAELAGLAYCQPGGTFITTLEELRELLGPLNGRPRPGLAAAASRRPPEGQGMVTACTTTGWCTV